MEAGPDIGSAAGDRGAGAGDRITQTAGWHGLPLRPRHPLRVSGVRGDPERKICNWRVVSAVLAAAMVPLSSAASAQATGAIDEVLQEAVADKNIPGIVAMAAASCTKAQLASATDSRTSLSPEHCCTEC